LNFVPTSDLKMIESSADGRVYEGTRGRKCQLEVNYLQILVDKLIKTAYQYDVEFDPPTPKKMLPKALEVFMQTHFAGVFYAFDGSRIFYTNQLLKVNGEVLEGKYREEVVAVLGDRSKPFKVAVQKAGNCEIDLSVLKSYKNSQYQYNDHPARAIQCLDVILRTAFKSLVTQNQAVNAGRALYFAPTNPRQIPHLGEGMELWYGLFQSAVLGRQSLYLNVDVAHKAFPSAIPLVDVLRSFKQGSYEYRDSRIEDIPVPTQLQDREMYQLQDYLKMLSIGYRLQPTDPLKTYGFNALVKTPRTALFVDDNGERMSVLEYYQRVKGITLRYPDLPCLHIGSKVRTMYVPLELCEIPAGQATNKKCTPNCVAKMIRYSATSTDDRKRKIVDLLNRINYSQPNGEVKGFGIDIDKKFKSIEGRVIDPPTIQYRNGSQNPVKGVWNQGNQMFIETQQNPVKWAVINCDNRTSIQQVMELKKNILNGARQVGMNFMPSVGNADYFTVNAMGRNNEIENCLWECEEKKYMIVFVIIIDMNDCYAKVKQAAELRVGILTQCIKANTIFRMGKGNPMMTIGNILLKVNAKLSGKNHEVNEEFYAKHNPANNGIMFVGADVTHPSPDQRDIPSVVGVAASHDQVGFRYQCAWRIQDPKQEMISDLEDILVEQLQFYKKKNNKLPGKLMYYRDGVSEGQFAEVLRIEMTAINAAMKRIYGTNEPAKVTFIVVQKRHHTRFFPTQRQFM
jgi:eukaryotic translation initiation factor 2C